MPVNKVKSKDPVCDMYVDPDQYKINFHGIHLAFCSKQCRERFRQNPGLYIGRPGTRAPRQEGMEIIKQRCFITAVVPDEHRVRTALTEMMGIKEIRFTSRCLRVGYDLLQVTATQIEERLAETGVLLSQRLSARIRRAWIHFQESNILQSLEVSTDTDRGKSCH